MKIESGKLKIENEATRKFLRACFVCIAFSILNFQFSILTGCAKYSVECELVVQPYVMISSGSDVHTPGYMVRVYAFYTDEAEYLNPNWWPRSYADAEAGLIRHRTTGEVRSYSLSAVQDNGGDGYARLILTKSPLVLVAVDPVNKFYAWRKFEYRVPLERVLLPVTFKIYQGNYEDTGSQWRFASAASENITQEEGEE